MDVIERDSQEGVQAIGAAPASRGRRVFPYLRIAVALILIILILQWVDFRAALSTIARTDARYVLLVIALVFLDRYLMAYKWNMLLKARGMGFSNVEAFRIYMASGFMGTFLPTGLGGDVFRAVRTVISGRKMEHTTASILVERVIGLLSITVMALVGLTVLIRGNEAQFRGLYLSVWALFVLLVAGISLSINERTFNLFKNLLSPFEKYRLVQMYLKLHESYMEFSRHRWVLSYFFLLSFLEQGVQSLMAFWAASALAFPVTVGYFFAVVPLSSLVVNLPISIDAIGVQEGAFIFLFAMAGLSPAESLALSLLMRVIGWLILVPAGLLFLYDSVRIKRASYTDNK